MYRYYAAARILLVFIPFMGYIHPDEFFQSVEVVAGKFLNVEHKLTWEFNTTAPIRSMALPYFTLGMCYKMLLGLDYLTKVLLGVPMLTSYFAILIPRLFMCLTTFVVDFSLYKICSNNNEKCKSRLVVLSTSYVLFTYGTRTFSNSFEMCLFAMLLYYVSESLTFSNQILRKKEYVQYRYSKSKSIPERAKFHKLNLYLKTDSLRNCFQISSIVVIGVFNRPTFLVYSTMPIFFWLYRGIGSRVISNIHFHLRILALVVCALPVLLFVVLVDSFYYGYISWGEIGMLDVSINSFVFTPWNFFKYNTNVQNLKQHGIHPRYLHFLVNMPLLFSILAVAHLYNLGFYFHRLTQSKYSYLPSIRSIKGLMTVSTLLPLSLLSLFPHQEPRFLIPLLLPLVYLYGTKILPEKESDIIKADPTSFKAARVNKMSNIFYGTWLMINFTLMIFYGYLHQGGVVSAMSHLSSIAGRYDRSVEIHLFSSHNYMLPQFLLLQRKTTLKIEDFVSDMEAYKQRVHVYDEGSRELEFLTKKIQVVYNTRRMSRGRFKTYLLIPSSLSSDMQRLIGGTNLGLTKIKGFFPHVVIEVLPKIMAYYVDLVDLFDFGIFSDFHKAQMFVAKLVEFFGLDLYEISEKYVIHGDKMISLDKR
ncbi:GPI mannosyltransferase 4-like isoform X1 [Coccinella septempunctata]|uniref:GPI mannosyltransferase 4-like isoform X1 n=2 Tax=Coccinella septempunctata TaxID=41139 RepID=UPI001D09643B|nr:GPI mannosyltransferase 4-like isoform X1 [Coccinella septempunctata]